MLVNIVTKASAGGPPAMLLFAVPVAIVSVVLLPGWT
jgi:hypothetical protein